MTTTNVIVHKSLTLAKGESVNEFMRGLNEAVQKHMMQKFNLSQNQTENNYWSVYPVEVYDGSIVAALYTSKTSTKYYAFKWERNEKSGQWTFGDSVEVERYTGYRAVAKSLNNNKVDLRSADGSHWSDR